MATEFPGAPVCPECGSIAICVQCNQRVGMADALLNLLAVTAVPDDANEAKALLRRIVERAEKWRRE
jgi:hypothetical protein